MYACMYVFVKGSLSTFKRKGDVSNPLTYMLKPSSKTLTNHRITKLLCKECLE